MTTKKDYTVNFMHYGDITVPAGTALTHNTAMGIDKNYHFVNEFEWIEKKYPDFSNILKMDVSGKGINVPIDYVGFSEEEKAKTFREDVDFWKKMFTPRTKKYLLEVRKRNNAPKSAELWTGKEAAQNQAIKELL